MDTRDLHRLAGALVQARRSMLPVARLPNLTKDDAREVKREVMRLLSEDGRRLLLGYKVSMSYTWGALFEGDVLASPASLSRDTMFEPLIETEAVFHLDRPIDGTATLAEVLATSRVSAGIEIADSRFQGWLPGDPDRLVMPRPADTEADNAFASAVVIDSYSVPAASLPLPNVQVTARRDGRDIACGTLDFVMGHPANVVLWLAQELARSGHRLEPGHFVFTGNPYHDFVTLGRHEKAQFDAVIAGVGTATLFVT